MKTLYRFFLKNIPRKYLIRLSYIFKIFSPIFYRGNNVECPICEHTFRKFLPYGVTQSRNNALCPKCLSLERHRLLWLFLQQKTDIFDTAKTVLHIAPEQCFVSRFRKMKNIAYTTADLESPLADIKLDVQNMPLDDSSFDIVICNHVLEHIDDDFKAMSEIFRVLKHGGFAILQVPADYSRENTYENPAITSPKEREIHFWQKDHVRLYGKDYPKRLEKVGFKVKDNDFLDNIAKDLKLRYCLPEKEFMFAALKS